MHVSISSGGPVGELGVLGDGEVGVVGGSQFGARERDRELDVEAGRVVVVVVLGDHAQRDPRRALGQQGHQLVAVGGEILFRGERRREDDVGAVLRGGEVEADLEVIRAYYAGKQGYAPEKAGDIRFRSPAG